MTKSETSKAPELSKRGGHRPHRNSTTSSKKPGSEMVVEEVARLTLADVSVGGKSGLKGGIPTPNAIPTPLSNGNGAPSGEKPKKPRGGKGKGKADGPSPGSASDAPNGDAKPATAKPKSRRGKGGGKDKADVGNVVEVEVHHKVEADGKKAIPAPKGGGSFVAPKPEGDEKEESKSRGAIPRKGVIPLPKGHPALDGAAAKPDPGAAEKKPKAKKEKKPKAERVDKENGDANGLDSNDAAADHSPDPSSAAAPKPKKKREIKEKKDDGSGVNRTLAQATGKEIRRHLETGNVDAAVTVFDAKQKVGGIDLQTATTLIMGLVRACHLAEAIQVADYLKERGMKMPLRQFTAIITGMSQRANPMDALEFLNALEHIIDYESKAVHNYHFHFAKLVVQEFLEEALQTLDRVANAPAFGLQESGLAAMDVVMNSSHKGGQLALNIPALGSELQRGLMKGDTVLLSRTGEAARQMGGEMPKGPGGDVHVFDEENLVMPTGPRRDNTTGPVGRGGARGGGWRADYEFEAEVSAMFPNLSVKLVGCTQAQAQTVRGGGWRVDKLANRTSFLRQLNALQDMVEVKPGTSQKAGVDPAIRDILVAGWDHNRAAINGIPDMCSAERDPNLTLMQRQRMIDNAMDLQAMAHMNKSQTDALEAALFQRVTLIQGPPGTGKTHTAVALVQMWLRNRTSPILCTSDSNIAVDNLVDGLSRAGVRVARIGRPEAVRQDLMQFMVESIAGIEPGSKMSKDQQYQAINGVLRRAEVVCATCAGAGSDILERFSFQACLIDEATQATEPATVVPLTKGCSQVVLIGDQKQLPPTIISREADAAGLGTSLFERMLSRGIRTFMLKVQYRMHPAIAAYPSKAFYAGALLSGTPPSARRAPMGFDWPVPAVPLAFVDVPDGYERSDGSSQTNPVEAQKIVNIVKKLAAGHDVIFGEIGVVTPYSAQVRAIKRLLNGNKPEIRSRFDAPADPNTIQALEVCSVDGFQGREKEVIVFCCTRANPNGNVGFLADPRRVNVMLTRARRGLIIIGNLGTLRRDPEVWGPWLQWAGDNGLICGLAAADADAASRLATIGMSSLEEIGGRGAGEVMTMGAMLSPTMWGGGGGGGGGAIQPAADLGPTMKETRDADVPDAWDDSDDDDDAATGVTTETESVTVKGSTNSLAGMADSAWDDDDDDSEESA